MNKTKEILRVVSRKIKVGLPLNRKERAVLILYGNIADVVEYRRSR